RRRHTRSKRDWSSDVCSSDLYFWLFFMLKCNQHTFLLKKIIIRRIIMLKTIFIFSSLIFILTACNNSIDKEIIEEKAKEIVINCHDSDVGEVDVIYVVDKYEKYIDKEITEEKAKEIVINFHDSDVGEVDVISVVDKSEKYIIKWENDPLEEGTDSVNKTTGELKTIESSRGSCEWK